MNNTFPVSKIKTQDTAMELRCVVAAPVLSFLIEKYGIKKTEQIISETQMSMEYLSDENNWISFDYFSCLLQKLVEITNDPMSPFYSAQQYTNTKSYKAIGFLVTHLGSPATMYKLFVKFHKLWNKIGNCKILESGSNSCKISIQFPRHKLNANNCLAIQGGLTAFPHIAGLPFAKLEETQCACKGADSCVYNITWTNKPERIWGLTGFITGLSIGLLIVFFFGANSYCFAITILLSLLGYFIGREWDYKNRLSNVYIHHEKTAISLLETVRTTERLNRELQQRVILRTEELSHANDALKKAVVELNKSQEARLLAEKQAAVGTLAGGMAHEMNSPINAARLSVQALEEELSDTSELGHILKTISNSMDRCCRIVNNLLSFSREPRRYTNSRIDETLKTTIELFNTEQTGNIKLNVDIQPDIPPLNLDELQIQQVIFNLLNNASDAMNGKGRIDISLKAEEHDVVLTVQDYGPGISKDIIKHIYDPFFTTKSQTGKGLGLGLAITYQLVKKNDGTIEVSSEANKGAIFTVRFKKESQPQQQTLLELTERPAILNIEDDQ
ncbi:sensor histidine kinase [Verrucomicrobiota bacterium]